MADPGLIVLQGAFDLRLVAVVTPGGLSVTLTGGDRPHIGCLVLAEPRPSLREKWRLSTTSSVLNRPGHREEELVRPLAELLALRLNRPVAVAAGIHLERSAGISGEELDLITRETELLTMRLLEATEAAVLPGD